MRKGTKHSEDTLRKMRLVKYGVGENARVWKGDKITYSGIHEWLRRNFGKSIHCDKCLVPGKKLSDGRWSIQYALREGFEYKRRRENFQPLCQSCHRKQDMTPATQEKLEKILIRARAAHQFNTRKRKGIQNA